MGKMMEKMETSVNGVCLTLVSCAFGSGGKLDAALYS